MVRVRQIRQRQFYGDFFFIEKLKTWVHQIKPISGVRGESKPTIEKKKLTLSGSQNPEYILLIEKF